MTELRSAVAARAPRGRVLAAMMAAGTIASLGGCATHAELRRVRDDQREVRGMLADLRATMDQTRRRLDTMKTELEDARRAGRVKSGGRDTTQLEERLVALEVRVGALEGGAPPPAPAPPEGGPAAGTPPAEAPPAAGAPSSEGMIAKEEAALQRAPVDDTYRAAFQLVRRGEYNQAVPRFREFLRRNPKSEFADNAQFWIGECYFAARDYNRAILEFNEVLLKYPKGEKVPAALLRQAYAFAELGDKVDARLILQKLLSEYPRSEEAEPAKQKLQALAD